jgi:flavorubredoxin
LQSGSQQQTTGLKTLILYWSATGNTRKVAEAIKKGVERAGIMPVLMKINEAKDEDLYKYDLVFIGSPSHQWLPPEPVQQYVNEKMKYHREKGHIKLCAPKIPGKSAVIFCTYGGPHTGINEAIPAVKYLGQLFEHIGFNVVREWYFIGEFHGHEDFNISGKMGDIRGRPTEQELSGIEGDVFKLVKSL